MRHATEATSSDAWTDVGAAASRRRPATATMTMVIVMVMVIVMMVMKPFVEAADIPEARVVRAVVTLIWIKPIRRRWRVFGTTRQKHRDRGK